MKVATWWKMHTVSYILGPRETPGRINPSFLLKSTKPSQSLKRHILSVLHFLCLISHQHMHHLLQMHSIHLIWIKGMGGNKGNKGTLWSQWIIHTPSSMGCHRRWQWKLAMQKGSCRHWKSVGSKLIRKWKQNAPQCAPLRMRGAVWPDLWANRMTFNFKNLFLRRQSQEGDTFAPSYPSFTVNWIRLKWCVLISFYWYLILNMYSTGAGANNGTDKFTRTNLMMQRDLCMNALTHA